jgi:hypothetical protein
MRQFQTRFKPQTASILTWRDWLAIGLSIFAALVSIASLAFSLWGFYFQNIRAHPALQFFPQMTSLPTITAFPSKPMMAVKAWLSFINNGNRPVEVIDTSLVPLNPNRPEGKQCGSYGGAEWQDQDGGAQAPVVVRPREIVVLTARFELPITSQQSQEFCWLVVGGSVEHSPISKGIPAFGVKLDSKGKILEVTYQGPGTQNFFFYELED